MYMHLHLYVCLPVYVVCRPYCPSGFPYVCPCAYQSVFLIVCRSTVFRLPLCPHFICLRASCFLTSYLPVCQVCSYDCLPVCLRQYIFLSNSLCVCLFRGPHIRPSILWPTAFYVPPVCLSVCPGAYFAISVRQCLCACPAVCFFIHNCSWSLLFLVAMSLLHCLEGVVLLLLFLSVVITVLEYYV